MRIVLAALTLFGSLSALAQDYEKIAYRCRCGCYDLYLTREIRYRLPGPLPTTPGQPGQYGTQRVAQHLVIHEENWGWSHEREIPGVTSQAQCHAYNARFPQYYRCGGYTDLPRLGGRWSENGFLTQCRYTPY